MMASGDAWFRLVLTGSSSDLEQQLTNAIEKLRTIGTSHETEDSLRVSDQNL